MEFKDLSFKERLGSMLKVDFGRMAKSRLFYIIVAVSFVIPILMTVMMTMMDGTVSVDQVTGETTVMEGPESVWQNIGTLPDGEAMGGADVFAMCNINMAFMGVAVFVCLFISEDFRSGFSKNLFTKRARKSDYVISKTLAGFACGSLMLIAYFIGSMLGGAISALPFDLMGLSGMNIAMCLLSKIMLMLVFVPVFVLISVAAKSRAWLSICGSLGGGTLLFMTVSMITPLESTVVNLLLCTVGGALFAVGLGAVSRAVLNKTALV